jgi:hypothetical protein
MKVAGDERHNIHQSLDGSARLLGEIGIILEGLEITLVALVGCCGLLIHSLSGKKKRHGIQ